MISHANGPDPQQVESLFRNELYRSTGGGRRHSGWWELQVRRAGRSAVNSDVDGIKTIKFFRDVKKHYMLHKWDRCRNRDSYLAEADGPFPR